MKNIKLFTHTDLDGIGCAILAKIAFKNENLNIEYCDYNNINEKVNNFWAVNNPLNWSTYITDISVNEEVAEMLNQAPKNITLLDHHPTALWLNKYKWAKVEVGEDEWKYSGTMLFYHSTSTEYGLYCEDAAYIFAEMVRMYDTWEWKTKYNDIEPKQLNDLFHLYGREKFVDEFVERISGDSILFTEHDEEILQTEENKINKYIDRKSKQIIETEILGYKAGVVFAEQYVSEMGNKLSEQNLHLDFIAMIDMGYKTVSYRTVKKDIDLGKDVAKVFGGGGHPQAAGSKISNLKFEEFITKLFIGGNQ